jgi:U3 small nucleolar RNA-associated protein 21
MVGFKDGNFCAVAGVDRVIRVFDIATCKLARRFGDGHSREITDMAFTPDGRRLLSSSMDGTVRVYDMPTGRCLSWLMFSSSVLSIAMSLSGEYMCVAQADKEGVYMYVDRSLYETVHFWKEPERPTDIAESLVRIDSDTAIETQDAFDERTTTDIKDESREPFGVANKDSENKSIESTLQRSAGAITLSTLPKAYWSNLFRLEEIKQRNKPKAPPSAPVTAPFFLPTVVREGAQTSFPTPQEFAKIQQEVADQKPQSGKRKADLVADGNEEEDISGLRAVWNDNQDDEDEDNQENLLDNPQPAKTQKLTSTSRISKKFQELPR